MRKTFYEMLEPISKEKTIKKKGEILSSVADTNVKTILKYTYDSNVKWLLPEGIPPYKPLDESSEQEGSLVGELRRLYIFVEGDTPTQQNLKPIRREQLFVSMLESLDPRDAKLLIGMKERKLPIAGLTKKLVLATFPELTEGW